MYRGWRDNPKGEAGMRRGEAANRVGDAHELADNLYHAAADIKNIKNTAFFRDTAKRIEELNPDELVDCLDKLYHNGCIDTQEKSVDIYESILRGVSSPKLRERLKGIRDIYTPEAVPVYRLNPDGSVRELAPVRLRRERRDHVMASLLSLGFGFAFILMAGLGMGSLFTGNVIAETYHVNVGLAVIGAGFIAIAAAIVISKRPEEQG
ncbi:MAG: hypothetical protein WCK90_02915 [archaeon]